MLAPPVRLKLTLNAIGLMALASAAKRLATPLAALASARLAPSAIPAASKPEGGCGAVRSSVKLNACEAADVLPATSTCLILMLLVPSFVSNKLDQVWPLSLLNSRLAPASWLLMLIALIEVMRSLLLSPVSLTKPRPKGVGGGLVSMVNRKAADSLSPAALLALTFTS